jgi:hypothetical protein
MRIGQPAGNGALSFLRTAPKKVVDVEPGVWNAQAQVLVSINNVSSAIRAIFFFRVYNSGSISALCSVLFLIFSLQGPVRHIGRGVPTDQPSRKRYAILLPLVYQGFLLPVPKIHFSHGKRFEKRTFCLIARTVERKKTLTANLYSHVYTLPLKSQTKAFEQGFVAKGCARTCRSRIARRITNMVTQKGSSSYSSSPLASQGKEGSPVECSSPQWQWGRKYKIHPEDVIMAALDHQMPTWRVVEAPGAVVVSPLCRPLPLGSVNAGTAAKSMLSPGRSKEEKQISRTTSAPRKRGSVRGAAAKAVFTWVRLAIDIVQGRREVLASVLTCPCNRARLLQKYHARRNPQVRFSYSKHRVLEIVGKSLQWF